MKRRSFASSLLAAALFATAPLAAPVFAQDDAAPAPEPTKLLRYPDVFENQVAFCYAGDIWKSDLDGKNVVRLTAHAGQEVFPKFSPDGKWIAFTGQYDGDDQVYVIPSTGGEPRQLTYYPTPFAAAPRRGVEAQTLGWTPDGKQVMFRSKRDSNSVDSLTNIYLVSVDGGLPTKIGTPVAGAGDLSPDGKRLVYSPLYRDFRHWKRYEGGWAQYLLIFNRETNEFAEIPTTPRTDRDPMWVGDRVYFVSDRDGTLNLYKYVPEEVEKPVQKLTDSTTWDVRWASSDGKSQIVYEYGGLLRVYNAETGETRELSIVVPHDGLAARPKRVSVSDKLESYGLSPKGERALFVARGDVFTVPQENGLVRNLTQTSGAHERSAVWSPDGRWVAFFSDETGEDQVYIIDQKGEKGKIQLTDSLTCKLDSLEWAPNGSALSFRDARNHLWALLLRSEDDGTPSRDKLVEVARDKYAGFPDAVWSPCGRYLAYAIKSENEYRAIYVWDKEKSESVRVTDPMFDNGSPAWSQDGDWLFFIGQREYYPQFSSIEWNFAGDRFDGIFAMALRKDVKNIFAPKSDEAEVAEAEEAKTDENADDAKDGEAQDAETADAKEIDFDGIESRVVRLPISSENYGGLSAAKDVLYFVQTTASYYGRGTDGKSVLKSFDLKTLKVNDFATGIGGYALSADGSKILVSQGGYKMYDVAPTAGSAKTFSTNGLAVDLNPREEWNEIFEEVWRRFRDYFYVRNMHGLDWNAVGDQYRSLLPHVSHRSDLTYILTEMIGELNIGHTYVEGGDYVVPERPVCALPGALFELDAEKNLYRLAKIFRGQNEEPKYRSPLTEVGVNASEGDYVLAIDGEKLVGNDNPYRLLQHKAGQVTLTLSKDGSEENAWTTVYVPLASEDNLRYLDFVLERKKRVEEASGGRLGYVHVPNMSGEGAYEFIKWYYPQIGKEGIVIDDRNNGGGNISPWIIMRLNQKLLGSRFAQVRETPTTYPTIACDAKLVCLINETSASDGDIFPHYFRKSGLGKLIGKRSWGGVVGISGRGPLTDGGAVSVPLTATNDETGAYVIEGHGVDPDIEVWQEPKAMLEGRDPQLERGIEELLKELEKDPKRYPQRPADPDKSKGAVKDYTK